MAEHLVVLNIATEAELDITYPDGTIAFCRDTGKRYKLVSGVFELLPCINCTAHAGQAAIHRNIVHNDACGFVEIMV